MKKYILTDKKKELLGRTLYQIQAVRSFDDVKEGEKGGWIEKEANLSHDGDCWVYENARIFGDAQIFETARVFGNARVFGAAQIFETARVFGNARVFGAARVFGNAKIFGAARIFGDAKIFEIARIFGDAQISGNARIFGVTEISSLAVVEKAQDFICFSSIGSRFGSATFYKNKNKGISVCCGCFNGTIEEFQNQVAETHGSNKFAKEYNLAIELAKIHVLGGKDE